VIPLKQCAGVFAFVLLAACAETRPGGVPADTELSVLDDSGATIPGEYEISNPANKDVCNSSGASCAVNVPEGDYTLSFTKVRFGRLVTSGGGNAGGDRGVGCLRARVHLVPGEKITCKQRVDFDCAESAVETMDCGPSAAARYGKTAPAAH